MILINILFARNEVVYSRNMKLISFKVKNAYTHTLLDENSAAWCVSAFAHCHLTGLNQITYISLCITATTWKVIPLSLSGICRQGNTIKIVEEVYAYPNTGFDMILLQSKS